MTPAKILIMGLPGAGKTTLARLLDCRLKQAGIMASVVDGDAVRTLYRDNDFSLEGRINQARRIGELADELNRQDITALCSFVCPTPETREAFWWSKERSSDVQHMIVFMDRLISSAYPDTNRMFVPPTAVPGTDFVVTPEMNSGEAADAVLKILGAARFDPTQPTALLVGRFQPFHKGHKALVAEAIADVGQVVLGLRRTGIDTENPLTAAQRVERIHAALKEEFDGRYMIIEIPNIEKIVYGRKPGYTIEQYKLDEGLEAISGTQLREQGL